LRDALHAVRHARLGWVAVAVVATALGLFASGVQLIGSTNMKLPLGRTSRVQLAAAFGDIAAPASLGRLGVDVGYLTQAGAEPTDATASVALDGLAGVAVHVALALLAVLVAGAAPHAFFHFQPDWLRWGLFGGGAVALIVLIGIWRHWWPRVLRSVTAAARAAEDTLQRPAKLAELLGGAFGVTITQIVALAACVWAVGLPLGFEAVAVVYLVAGGVASLAPTPGSLGAVEAALVAGLVAAGAPSPGAVTAVLTFRLITFWAPLVPGAVAFVDLRRQAAV
jgi:undecaprenyl-diphosphatase